MKYKDYRWLKQELFYFGWNATKLKERFAYSQSALSTFFNGRQPMPEYLKIELINLVLQERKKEAEEDVLTSKV